MSDSVKIAELERKLQQLEKQVFQMAQRINFLERENQRRRSDVNQLAQRKG